jgi:hypothetical protein
LSKIRIDFVFPKSEQICLLEKMWKIRKPVYRVQPTATVQPTTRYKMACGWKQPKAHQGAAEWPASACASCSVHAAPVASSPPVARRCFPDSAHGFMPPPCALALIRYRAEAKLTSSFFSSLSPSYRRAALRCSVPPCSLQSMSHRRQARLKLLHRAPFLLELSCAIP